MSSGKVSLICLCNNLTALFNRRDVEMADVKSNVILVLRNKQLNLESDDDPQ